MPTILPQSLYCVKLTKVNVNENNIARITFLTAPGHGPYARQIIETDISLSLPLSKSAIKMCKTFRIDPKTPEDIISAKGRWGFIAVYWESEGWEPRAAIRFIRQTPQMRQQSIQIEQVEYEGCLDWPCEADETELDVRR